MPLNSYEDKVDHFLTLSRARVATLGFQATKRAFRDQPYDEQTSVAARLLDINEALSVASDLTGEEKLVLISVGTRLGSIDESDWPGTTIPNPPGGGVIIVDMGLDIQSLKFSPDGTKLVLKTNRGDFQDDVPASVLSNINLTAQGPIPISLGGFQVADQGVYTPDQFANKLLRPYLAPAFSAFMLSGQAGTIEVGSQIAAGSKTFIWATTNSARVALNSIKISNITQAVDYLTNQPNDGTENYTLASPIAFNTARSELLRITGVNTNAQNFARDLTITSTYKWFYGPVITPANNSATVRALVNSRFTNAGDAFILDTGNTQRIFQVWAPTGKTLSMVIDLDALNANITSQYVPSALSVNDAAGTPVSGTLYTMTQSVPYSTSHRHQLQFS